MSQQYQVAAVGGGHVGAMALVLLGRAGINAIGVERDPGMWPQAPPLFGQGLCSGLRDVANLVWKLRLVALGKCPPTCSTPTGRSARRMPGTGSRRSVRPADSPGRGGLSSPSRNASHAWPNALLQEEAHAAPSRA